jgi:hypothetical protein
MMVKAEGDEVAFFREADQPPLLTLTLAEAAQLLHDPGLREAINEAGRAVNAAKREELAR